MTADFSHKGILSKLLLSAALVTPYAPVAAQTPPVPPIPQLEKFPEAMRPFLFNKSNQPVLKPTLAADLFVIPAHAETFAAANKKLEDILTNPSRANIEALYPAYKIYAEDCVGTVNRSGRKEGLSEAFQSCLYDTTKMATTILSATVRTPEQADAVGLSNRVRENLTACQKEHGITPGQREKVGFIPAVYTMSCAIK